MDLTTTIVLDKKGLELTVGLSEKERIVFNKILPLKDYIGGNKSPYTPAYSLDCNACKQCPGCGCMCNND